MGREARCHCRWDGEAAEVKALLETAELILRGDLRRRVPLADIREVAVRADELQFRVGPSRVALTLGAKAAASWAKKLTTPAPSLRERLGLGATEKALVIGQVAD